MRYGPWRRAGFPVPDAGASARLAAFREQLMAGEEPGELPEPQRVIGLAWRSSTGGRRLQVRVDDPRRTCRAEAEFAAGRLVDLHLTARDGEAISTFDMKSPSIVADMRRFADVARRVEAGEGQRVVEVGREVGAMLEASSGRTIRRRRTRREAGELLSAVATGYRELTADPLVRNVRAALTRRLAAEGYSYHPGHVGRLIMQARAAKLLGPPIPGRAGEAAAPARPKRPRGRKGNARSET